MNSAPVLDTPIAATDYLGAVQRIKEMALDRTRAYAVEAAATQPITMARHTAEFRAVMDRFDLVLPDGMPLVWVLNRKLPADQRIKDSVNGATLMATTLEHTQGQPEFSHFLLGGAPDTLELLKETFASRFPGARIADTYSPPFGAWDEAEIEKMFHLIRESGASLIWVGLGCPKQERWIAQHKDRLPPGVYFGVGAAFLFHAGKVKRSPRILQKLGLEWLFRLAMEPRRLFTRYAKYNSLYLWYVFRDALR